MEPLQNGCKNKNVTEHKVPTQCMAADTDYANECSMQPHYEPEREVVFLRYFPDEQSPEEGKSTVLSTVCLFRGLEKRKTSRCGREKICVCVGGGQSLTNKQ